MGFTFVLLEPTVIGLGNIMVFECYGDFSQLVNNPWKQNDFTPLLTLFLASTGIEGQPNPGRGVTE
jgi:hypothetical protein